MRKSLLGQIVQLIALVIVINFIGFFAAIRLSAVTPAAEHIGDLTVNQLKMLKALKATSSNATLEEVLSIADLKQDIVLSRTPPTQNTPAIGFYEKLSQRLRLKTSENLLIAYADMGSGPRLWLKPAWTGDVWLGFRFPPYGRDAPFWILVTVILSVSISALLGVAYARHISRSLTRLGKVAADIYSGTTAPAVPISGPREVRQLTDLVRDSAQRVQALAEYRKMLLAGISHDLRTPLSRIRIALEMSADDDLREGMIADVEEMDATIGDFIQFVRDGEEEAVEAVDLSQVITEIAHTRQRNKQQLATHIDQSIAPVNLRPNAIRRAIDNLVGNAFRHGQAPVSCTLGLESGNIRIAVRDQGKGIAEELIGNATDAFSQAESARTNIGSGLGLAIVERIVEQHGGKLDLQNADNGGLIATITLPAADAEHS